MATNASDGRAPVEVPGKLKGAVALTWILAVVTGVDYFDNATFSFFAGFIAGGVHASADQLVWASTSYAVAAVMAILQQQWWTDRLGHRRYFTLFYLIYAVAAVGAGFSESALELAVMRAVQGYCLGPIMGASRILMQMKFAGPSRSNATRAFLTMILLGTACAPLFGGWLITHFGWRALFLVLAPLGLGCALLAWLGLPDSGSLEPHERGRASLWPYVAFAFAQGALQITMQQARHEVFSASPWLLGLAAAGVLALLAFVWHQWDHPQPYLRLHALRERGFRTGIVLYIFYFYLATGFSYLLPRLLEQGLGISPQQSGQMIGFTSLISIVMLFAYFRWAPRVTRKKFIIVPGFALAAAAALWAAHLPAGVGLAQLYGVLLLRSLLLFFIALPVANLTFRPFEIDEFTHGYRLKNIVRQLTISFSTSTVIVLEQHRFSLHAKRLAEAASPLNSAFAAAVRGVIRLFQGAGDTPTPPSDALAEIGAAVARQAMFLASRDGFLFLAGVALVGGVFAVWQKAID
ncbi:MAG: MFS transporter [Janthinobacterium lividum]